MKRTPLVRTAFHRKEPSCSRSEHPRAKDKECAAPNCEVRFIPKRMEHVVCSPGCLIAKRKADALAEKERRKAEKANDKVRAQALKSVKQLKAEAQDAFNDWVRARDADLPCVSCGVENPPMTTGGQWDAGHFLGRGAYPELAFDEDNCHKQCKSCNAGSGKFSHKARTVAAAYEEELLIRIGPERLARLKGPHVVIPLEKDELEAIKATYRAKRKALITTP